MLNARIGSTGATPEERVHRQKRKSMENALIDAYQAETITFNGEEIRCLINNFKNQMNYDDKVISIGYEHEMKVGDVFYWNRTGDFCLVYLEEKSEDAYFRGNFRVASHVIKWKDDFGIERESHAAVRGPVETVIRGQMKSGTAYDQRNKSLDILLPYNSLTKDLKRYGRIMLEGQAWEITADDFISEPGVLNLSLVEHALNRDRDTTEVVDGKVETDLEVWSNLMSVSHIEKGSSTMLSTIVRVNGVVNAQLAEDAVYTVQGDLATIEDNTLSANEPGEVDITLTIDRINHSQTFTIEIEEVATVQTVEYKLSGNSVVKSFGVSEYSIEKLVSGLKVAADGSWQLEPNSNLFSVESESVDSIALRWVTGRGGTLTLNYLDEHSDIVASKDIVVETLF